LAAVLNDVEIDSSLYQFAVSSYLITDTNTPSAVGYWWDGVNLNWVEMMQPTASHLRIDPDSNYGVDLALDIPDILPYDIFDTTFGGTGGYIMSLSSDFWDASWPQTTNKFEDTGNPRRQFWYAQNTPINAVDDFTITLLHDESWDKSSIEVTGSCRNGYAVFKIANGGDPVEGDMDAPSEYRIYRNGLLESTHPFQLDGGKSLTVSVESNGDTIKLEADQRPGHPGKSKPNAIIEDCGGSEDEGTPDGGGTDGDPEEDPSEEDVIDGVDVVYDVNHKNGGRLVDFTIAEDDDRMQNGETDVFVLTVEGAKNKVFFKTIDDDRGRWKSVKLMEGKEEEDRNGYLLKVVKIEGDEYTLALKGENNDAGLKTLYLLFSNKSVTTSPADDTQYTAVRVI
jgi:hypothetical protein